MHGFFFFLTYIWQPFLNTKKSLKWQDKRHGEKTNIKKEKFPAKSFMENKSCQEIVSGSSLKRLPRLHGQNDGPYVGLFRGLL